MFFLIFGTIFKPLLFIIALSFYPFFLGLRNYSVIQQKANLLYNFDFYSKKERFIAFLSPNIYIYIWLAPAHGPQPPPDAKSAIRRPFFVFSGKFPSTRELCF